MARSPRLEITDVIIDHDPESLARRPVTRAAALSRLEGPAGSAYARRLVARIPCVSDTLEEAAVDRIFLIAHAEMQRLWEEFLHGPRVVSLLRPFVDALRANDPRRRARVVDVGCGTGYVLRYLSASEALGEGVSLIGADYNEALIAEARRLAKAEALGCEFVVANAFQLETRASIYLSTGVLHHFTPDALASFFRRQAEACPEGFMHFDIQANPLAPIGAWIFHAARMRSAVSRHDGTLSAQRAHDWTSLERGAREGAPGYRLLHYNRRLRGLPMLRTMHAIIGLRPDLLDGFMAALSPGVRRRITALE